MQNLITISANLQTMAKELEEAQEKADKLSKKGSKANAIKVEAATGRLESATQQWESQAPFIFETLQAVDEQRINHLRDVLTQLETHEVDQASRTQASAEEVLNSMLEIDTNQEVQGFVERTIAGRPKLEPRRTGTSTRQSSTAGGSTLAPPSASGHEDDVSDHSSPKESQSGKLLRKNLGELAVGVVFNQHYRISITKQDWYDARAQTSECTRRLRLVFSAEASRTLFSEHCQQPWAIIIAERVFQQPAGLE
jgi:hypothetical protein